jgi:hypothetical protein
MHPTFLSILDTIEGPPRQGAALPHYDAAGLRDHDQERGIEVPAPAEFGGSAPRTVVRVFNHVLGCEVDR